MTNSSRSSSPPTSSSPGDATPAGSPRRITAELAAPSITEATINLCGELCPFTFVRTKLALEELPIGALLRVIVDHEPAIRNIPRSATEWGQDVVAVTRLSSRTWAIDLRKRVR
jgi:tRNA 2-thiouridine synthesizing protein A